MLNEINGLDDKSISAAYKLVGYDVCFRAGIQYYKPVENINPDKDTIENIRTMIERTEKFYSDKDKYSKIKNLAIYNPRLNKIFIIPINRINNEKIKEVEEKVIGYRKVQQNNKTKYDEYKDYYTITELTQILKCSRHKIMQLYSMEDLPLKMVKNRYIVNKLKLMEWLDEKEKERKEEKIKNVILGVVSIVLMLIIFYMLGVLFKFRFI